MTATLQGQLLVAANHLRDSNFFRAVVLMLEHDEDSAMGLVINRPSSLAVDAAVSQLDFAANFTDPIFSGGPVETRSLFILHSAGVAGDKDSEIARGVYLTGSNESFESLVEGRSDPDQPCAFRIYCGYAGWGPGQLESEIERGDWRILPASRSAVFDLDPYEVWDACTKQIQQEHRLLPHNVDNPEWN